MRAVAALLCAGLLALLAACGERGLDTAALSADVVAARVAEQHLRRHLTQSPGTLDPAMRVDLAGVILCDDLFEGLVRLGPDGSIVPGVATHWSSSEDALTWTFHLRPDARWSNGDAVTADDFVYAWRRVVNPVTASQGAQQLAPLAGATAIATGAAPLDSLGVQAVDAQTLVVRLRAVTPHFLYLLTTSHLFPVHRATVEAHGQAWTRPEHLVGNGPFTLESRAINGPVVMARNPGYWDAAQVKLQRVTYLPLPDNVAATSRFLAGDLDVTDTFLLDDLPWLRRDLPRSVRIAPYYGTVMLGMNTALAPFDNRALRQAMVLAVDREILTGKLLKEVFQPAYGLVPPLDDYPGVRPDWADLPGDQRLARARQLYAEAGYSPQRPLDVELTYMTTNADTRRVLEALAAMWRINLGANVRLANQEFGVYLQNRQMGALRLFWYAWIGDYPDPMTFLSLPMKDSGYNDFGFDNPRYDALMREAMNATDTARRHARYADAERLLAEEAVTVPVYFYQSRHLLREHVRGWMDNPMDRHLSRDLRLALPGGGG